MIHVQQSKDLQYLVGGDGINPEIFLGRSILGDERAKDGADGQNDQQRNGQMNRGEQLS